MNTKCYTFRWDQDLTIVPYSEKMSTPLSAAWLKLRVGKNYLRPLKNISLVLEAGGINEQHNSKYTNKT